MKSRDTNPSAARAVTPETGSTLEGAPAQADEEERDSGKRGHLPIAVSEGDFSTPTQRTRTITRPRGLRTLESQLVIPEVGAVRDAPAAALPLQEIPRHEASVVDEFLAAPPTPVPEMLETPIPQIGPSPTDLWGLSDVAAQLDEMDASGQPAAAHLQKPSASSDGVTVADPYLADDLDVFTDVRVEDHDGQATQTVDALLDQATVEILAETPSDESAHVLASTAAIENFVAALPEPVTEEIGAPPGDGAAPSDGELSPLAQTLANMAESMHGDPEADVALDASIDLDIADGPLLPLPVEPLSEPPVRTPAARPTPPPIPTAAAPSLDTAAGAGRTASAVAPPSAVAVPAAPLAALPEALVERPRRPKRSKPWFEEVFDESYLRTLPFMTAEQTLQEVDFIESSLGLPRGSEVLDVGCGYGRHAIELVQRGLSVTGVDLSLPLLIRAADESQRRGVAVNFVHTDMREMSFERQFSGAYCMLTSFGYFDDESNLRVAEGIARALKPGGRFLIDVLNRDYIVGDLPARVWWEGDGCVVLEEVDFNFNTNRVLTHRSVVFEDGQQLEQEISVRVYSLHELGKLLRRAGFRVIEVSGSIPTRGHFFGAHSRNLLILAERRSE